MQRLLRSHGGRLDVESSAVKMCEFAARSPIHHIENDSYLPFPVCCAYKRLQSVYSGDLDSIKILVENGVDFMVGNDDMRTV